MAGELWNLKMSVRWLLFGWEGGFAGISGACLDCFGSAGVDPFVLARFVGRTMTSSSSSASGSGSGAACFRSLSSTGEAARFLDERSWRAAESFEVLVCEEGFWEKKLEMVACLRFKDGDGAEGDWEEKGAMVKGGTCQSWKWGFRWNIKSTSHRAVMPLSCSSTGARRVKRAEALIGADSALIGLAMAFTM